MNSVKCIGCLLAACMLSVGLQAGNIWKVGFSKVDITPDNQIWMAGFAMRETPSQGVRQNLSAKAVSIEDENGSKAVIVTMDLLNIPKFLSDRVRDYACKKYSLDRSRIILNVSHTHSGPVLTESLKYIYPMSSSDWKVADRYTERLEKQLKRLIDDAMKNPQPAVISAGSSRARFCINRRENKRDAMTTLVMPVGPSDYTVPVFKIEDTDGNVKVILFGYACHPTTLSDCMISGDYAGFAQSEVEKLYPGVQAMFFQGAGADQNPNPRNKVSHAVQYGKELCAAVEQAMTEEMAPLESRLDTRYEEVNLPLEEPMSIEALEELGKGTYYQARWARGMVDEYKKKGSFITEYPYPVEYWRLGDIDIFALGGELTVEYALELKKIYGENTVVMGYCNDVMTYVPSERVWDKGGYESRDACMVYALPARWTRDVQSLILNTVRQLAPLR